MPLNINTNNLVKVYGGRSVVNHVSIEVKQGEIVGLLGPNGAGKTTTFYQVVGLIKPDEGEVFLGDENITKLPMYKRAQMGIGYLPQEPSVFRKLSVEDNIAAVLEMMKLSKQEQKEKQEQIINEFHLQKVRKLNGDVVSGGERRRTEIARALAVDPKFILLDEPFAGIDPIAVEDIQSIVARLKYKNIGILITDHNVTETLSICDRAYLLIEGKIFKHGTAEELAADEQVRKLYLGRNFELKRKDYLHEEAKNISESFDGAREIKPELLSYSVKSAVEMMSRIINLPITVVNIRNPEELGLKDISSFLPELKKAIIKYGLENGSKKFNEIATSIPVFNHKDYGPNGILLSLLSYVGRFGAYLAYQPSVNRLNGDLQNIKSILNRLSLLIENPAFEEAMTDN